MFSKLQICNIPPTKTLVKWGSSCVFPSSRLGMLPQRRPSRLRRSGRDITAALISANYLLFNIGWYWSVLAGTGLILGGAGQYLVVTGWGVEEVEEV